MKQAEEKSFGTKPNDIIVSEKMVLIHSEISEAYEAYLANNLGGKDGFYEELGDVLQRTLHLGAFVPLIFLKILILIQIIFLQPHWMEK